MGLLTVIANFACERKRTFRETGKDQWLLNEWVPFVYVVASASLLLSLRVRSGSGLSLVTIGAISPMLYDMFSILDVGRGS